MRAICGMDCCAGCSKKEACGGCAGCEGEPMGGRCVAAKTISQGGEEAFLRLKNALIAEINALGIPHLQVADLNLLNGFFVNLEYPLPSGQTVKLLNDSNVYFGNQIEVPGSERCYGVVADETFLLVCSYGCEGAGAQIVCYRTR